MTASTRLSCLLALALLAACKGPSEADNLADLDARLTNGAISEADAANDAIALAAAGGRIQKAPKAVIVKGETQGRSLGNLARDQAAGKTGAAEGSCAKDVKTGPEWADRMPEPFRLYPGGKLVEAAGLDKERCTLRIISFTTASAVEPIMDFYYTQARRAGYDAEHLLVGGEHQLGGTRQDGAAYVVFARAAKDGGTEVDLVANAVSN